MHHHMIHLFAFCATYQASFMHLVSWLCNHVAASVCG